MKKLSILTLALALLFTATPLQNYADDKNIEKESVEVIEVIDSSNDMDEPIDRSQMVVIDNEDVTAAGSVWNQLAGFSAYRVWVNNTTNEKMKVTVSYGHGHKHVKYIKAHSGGKIVVNNAVEGMHTIDFTTSSGNLTGTVSVRISTESL